MTAVYPQVQLNISHTFYLSQPYLLQLECTIRLHRVLNRLFVGYQLKLRPSAVGKRLVGQKVMFAISFFVHPNYLSG